MQREPVQKERDDKTVIYNGYATMTWSPGPCSWKWSEGKVGIKIEEA